MNHKSSVVLANALLLLASASCATGSKQEVAAHTGEHALSRVTALSREAAAIRSKQIARVSYVLWFGLSATQTEFEGRTVINFELRPKAREISKDVVIDFEGGKIHTLSINGGPLAETGANYDGHRIRLRLDDLQAGINRVEIAYSQAYSRDGMGLHRFVDPVDERVYLYSNLEPYSAHRIFPCFDQPDLKAPFELTVDAPDGWQVIANTKERDVTKVDGRRSWAFPPSPAISTYVFALHAGPYHVWSSDANGIPLRLFARESLAKYVEPDKGEWFEITAKGLDFFHVQFGYPYPYAKYDQLLVPEFNSGGMENAGAVTFTEHLIYRSKVTEQMRQGRAEIILHEMAHMWFGDLVTMKWWNGLWLNESFATFMGVWATEEVTRFKGAWRSFFREKGGAYQEDQRVTTHPVEVPIRDTDEALSNFDGISYGKGAAGLKQLRYYLGEDDFREGTQRYIQKFALRNTSIADFFRMLGEASGVDLVKWQRAWFHTTGVNGVRVDWACGDDERGRKTITKFNIFQTPSEGNGELRPHRMKVGLYELNARRKLALKDTLEVTYSAAETPVSAALGKHCPDLVFPNHGDEDYVKTEFDPTSIEALRRSISALEDPFARQMAWSSLWEMVLDAKLSPQDFAEMAHGALKQEKDTQILSQVVGNLASPFAARNSVLKFVPLAARGEFLAKLDESFRERFLASPAGSDSQLIWFEAFLANGSSEKSQALMRGLLNGKAKARGLRIDVEWQWKLVKALARNGVADAPELIDEQLKRDATDSGQRAAIAAETMIPNAETKKKWIAQAMQIDDRAFPSARMRDVMSGLAVIGQEEFLRESAEAYWKTIARLAADPLPAGADDAYLRHFPGMMFPSVCEAVGIQHASEALSAYPNLPPVVVKALKVRRQEEERCIRIREKAEKAATR